MCQQNNNINKNVSNTHSDNQIYSKRVWALVLVTSHFITITKEDLYSANLTITIFARIITTLSQTIPQRAKDSDCPVAITYTTYSYTINIHRYMYITNPVQCQNIDTKCLVSNMVKYFK